MRAFDPWPGTFTRVDGKLLKVLKARVVEGSGAAATVIRAGAEGLVIACGQGALAIDELQLEGRKRMRAADFLAGFKVEMGKQLGT